MQIWTGLKEHTLSFLRVCSVFFCSSACSDENVLNIDRVVRVAHLCAFEWCDRVNTAEAAERNSPPPSSPPPLPFPPPLSPRSPVLPLHLHRLLSPLRCAVPPRGPLGRSAPSYVHSRVRGQTRRWRIISSDICGGGNRSGRPSRPTIPDLARPTMRTFRCAPCALCF